MPVARVFGAIAAAALATPERHQAAEGVQRVAHGSRRVRRVLEQRQQAGTTVARVRLDRLHGAVGALLMDWRQRIAAGVRIAAAM